METIKLDAGIRTYKVQFAGTDDTAEIRFNPSDPTLAVRFQTFEQRLQACIDKVGDIPLGEDGKPLAVEAVSKYAEFENELRREIDETFNADMSNVLFKHCAPLAIVNGEYFVVQVFSALAPLIRKAIDADHAAMEKHIGKYGKK